MTSVQHYSEMFKTNATFKGGKNIIYQRDDYICHELMPNPSESLTSCPVILIVVKMCGFMEYPRARHIHARQGVV